MNCSNRILKGPVDTSNIPHGSFGKLCLDYLKSYKPDSTVLIDIASGRSYTYKKLIEQSQNLAFQLKKLGITKNNTVAIISQNSDKFCVVYLAALLLGAPLHLISRKSTEYELHHFLNLSKPKLVLCFKESEDVIGRMKLCFVENIVLLDDDFYDSSLIFNKLVMITNLFEPEEDFDSKSHTALICNSSGTTGLPKGVMLSHANLRMHFISAQREQVFYMESDENVPVVLPLNHIYAIHVLNGAWYCGATLILFDKFQPKIFLKYLQNYSVQRLYIVPTLTNFLLYSPLVSQYDLSALKYVCNGGSTLLQSDKNLLKEKFLKLTQLEIYGLSESTGMAVFYKDSEFYILSGNEIKVVDLVSGCSLAPHQNGEVCIKGAITTGYINNGEETKKAIDSEGFFHSGDLGYYDTNGTLYIVGRIKDIIKYKSFQVSPSELENVLKMHPAVEDAAVAGKMDDKHGEIPVGFIVKKKGMEVTEEEICSFVAKHLSKEKWLHGVTFVQKVPRTSTGKILRQELQKLI